MPKHDNSDNPNNHQSPSILDPLPKNDSLPTHNRLPAHVREAIAQAVIQEGQTVTAVAEAFGVRRHTVAEIVKEYITEFFPLRDLQLATKLDGIAEAMLQRLEDNVDELPPGQLPVAAGIILDKRQVLVNRMGREQAPFRLRIAWQDGSGAVELTVGGSRETGGHVRESQDEENIE